MSEQFTDVQFGRYLALASRYSRPHASRLAVLAVFVCMGIALQVIAPGVLRSFIDSAVSGQSPQVLQSLALLYIIISAARQLFSALGRHAATDAGWRATNTLRRDLSYHCLRLDLAWHRHRPPGEMIERIDGDISTLAGFFSQFIVGVIANTVLLVILIALLYAVDWRIGPSVTLLTIVAVRVLWVMRKRTTHRWATFREASARFFGALSEWLIGLEEIRANGARHYVLSRFHALLRQWYPTLKAAGMARFSLYSAGVLMFGAITAAALGLSAQFYLMGEISIGTVYLVFAYTDLIRRPLEQIRTHLQDLQRAGASIGRIEHLLATESRIRRPEPGARLTLPSEPLSVAFNNVSFSYESEPVLRDVSFRLEPGRVLGLCGRTGSGKITIARLLLRLWDPVEGDVRLAGVPTTRLDPDDLRQRVGVVTQDVRLFAGSVRDNLRLFGPGIDDRGLTGVLYEAGLGQWYESLPNGLDTQILGAGSLSAGESQLLAFARLLLSDPGLVILDEASSRLDAATEHHISRAIDSALQNRTAIIIAHRLSTLNRVDEVLILDGGRVLEYGEREYLAKHPDSHFRRLLEKGPEEVLA